MSEKKADLPKLENVRVCVIGLGYVGLPLAVEFGKHFPTIGFDTSTPRISELKQGADSTREVSKAELNEPEHLSFVSSTEELPDCNVFVVTVPTPIDIYKRPNLEPLFAASASVGKVIKRGSVVIFESTVYPGATEEDCIPVIEQYSNLKANHDFYAGYSPERINPGDKEHRISDIKKVTSGSTPEAAQFVDQLYRTIISAGTFLATSIRVAEAAKVIENTQRDVNIALINELAMIFSRLNIATDDVLEAAGTKWNFLPFKPGLVGGHCIGVDPYYLTHKAQSAGYHPEVILSGRRINDSMGQHVADRVLKLMIKKGINPIDAQVLVLGLAFKENCPDLRNTKVVDVIEGLKKYHINVSVYDPWVDADSALEMYGLRLEPELANGNFDAVILAVGHAEFRALTTAQINVLTQKDHVIFDIKNILPNELVTDRL